MNSSLAVFMSARNSLPIRYFLYSPVRSVRLSCLADKRDCLITAFKHHALNVEMDIPFRRDLIPQAAVKYDTVPYTYRLQASVVKDVFFEFFKVLFFTWLYKLIKLRIPMKLRDRSVVHTDSSVRVISSTSTHSFMEKLARHSFGFSAP